MADEEKNVVVIEDDPIVEETDDIQVEELTEEEKKMAEDQGIIPKESEKKKDKKEVVVDEKQDDDKKPEEQGINAEDLDSFEKLHDLYQTDAVSFHKLPRNVKNLYHNSKALYKQMKHEEERRKEIESGKQYEALQDAGARARLTKIKERLKNPDDLTVEELNKLLGEEEKAVDEKDKPLTKKDLEEIESKKAEEVGKTQAAQQAYNHRIVEAEQYAEANIKGITDGKYESLDDVLALAKEIAQKKPRYLTRISQSFQNADIEIPDVVDEIIDIARLNPKWGGAPSGENGKTDLDRMVKNSRKQPTSANLSGGKGGRVVTYDELTPEDALKLSPEKWAALPHKVRMGILNKL